MDWYESNVTQDNVAVVRSKPSEVGAKGLLGVNVWTNFDFTGSVNSSKLLAIYTQVG